MKPRIGAARVLADLLRHKGSLASSLPAVQEQVDEGNHAMLRELCYGTMRYYPRLQLIARKLLDKPLRAKDSDIQALLLLGLYQLDFMRIPDHAAIGETAGAAKALKKPWATGVINGALRRYQREGESIVAKLGGNPEFQKAHPQWLIDAYRKAWPEHYTQMLEANNAHPPLSLRIDTQQVTREDYLERLTQQNIEAKACRYSSCGITLDKPADPTGLPGFDTGLVSVQDEAAQLAAPLLELAPGQRVLDACSAPGGKTGHILQLQPQLEEVVALDCDQRRLKRVQENLDRLGVHAQVQQGDASQTADWWSGKLFDRILLDAPCSATGIIRRQSDIKLLRRPDDIATLTHLQNRLLDALWATLKPGGILLYATCSALPDENSQVVAAFVNRTPDCASVGIEADWGLAQPHGRQLLQASHHHDGFYYAKLTKIAK
ncbi:16S rRNA (cytosine(967)-C(5))-methyltransferase RsmB [Gilvimarinus agarilyticus]|uniref:16S rRNA (cytosine(967)-C(5))-methyltransferase RsmB n=1 Tax=unclassified Gilvimarinus TaxID=2642066 RepID=UPI001C098208|nr:MULTISPECIES: 16S rRNA (cytosine(967)-C(5))-methyltransferase RsmB [unclassified Gilvimarinus]MBU2884241.1 16S rRNA (cytosine(967)-C(5))-methyltransferase RsmB [Gilvimarinus agarilyticus]MDO6569380.1 16S rRNA (cytosine(967)-C(5))-methyltransferase RsmB [Gilvimarinus sp. 2_MG-2023]MDO6747534.1 16S rRNA (cytosine(967)-C(5))-methyltransferase RsmB [Gilvimarinus sp. 1_MG-2023]